MRNILTTIVISIIMSGFLFAQDKQSDLDKNWPHWRGPLANGVSPNGNPPSEWNEEKNVKWKVEIPGTGYETPVIWGDQIIILTAIEVEGTEKPKEQAEQPQQGRRRGMPSKGTENVDKFVVLSVRGEHPPEHPRHHAQGRLAVHERLDLLAGELVQGGVAAPGVVLPEGENDRAPLAPAHFNFALVLDQAEVAYGPAARLEPAYVGKLRDVSAPVHAAPDVQVADDAQRRNERWVGACGEQGSIEVDLLARCQRAATVGGLHSDSTPRSVRR